MPSASDLRGLTRSERLRFLEALPEDEQDRILVLELFASAARPIDFALDPDLALVQQAAVQQARHALGEDVPHDVWPQARDEVGGWRDPTTVLVLLEIWLSEAVTKRLPTSRKASCWIAIGLTYYLRQRIPGQHGARDDLWKAYEERGTRRLSDARRRSVEAKDLNAKELGPPNPVPNMRKLLARGSGLKAVGKDVREFLKGITDTALTARDVLAFALGRAPAPQTEYPDPLLLTLLDDGLGIALGGTPLRYRKKRGGVDHQEPIRISNAEGRLLMSLARRGGVPANVRSDIRTHLGDALEATGHEVRLDGAGSEMRLTPVPKISRELREAFHRRQR